MTNSPLPHQQVLFFGSDVKIGKKHLFSEFLKRRI